MKVWVHAPRENWIVDRIAAEFYADNSDIATTDPRSADVIWAPAGWCVDQLVDARCPIVSTVHHIFDQKPEQAQHILKFDRYVSAYHVPNERTRTALRTLTKKEITVIPYWINTTAWYPITREEREMARTSLGIEPQTTLLGSFQRDTEGFDGQSPKLEKGPDVFCDYVESRKKRGENIAVLLTGYRRQYVTNRLRHANVKILYIENAPAQSMRWLYGALDLYVVSSRCEGGPQALIECAACMIPIISTPVGLAETVLSQESVNIDLLQAQANTQIAAKKVLSLSTSNVFSFYREMLKKAAGKK